MPFYDIGWHISVLYAVKWNVLSLTPKFCINRTTFVEKSGKNSDLRNTDVRRLVLKGLIRKISIESQKRIAHFKRENSFRIRLRHVYDQRQFKQIYPSRSKKERKEGEKVKYCGTPLQRTTRAIPSNKTDRNHALI